MASTELSELGSSLKGLTDKEARFVFEYALDYNGARAVRAAGYSPKGADVRAVKLLKKPKIAAILGKLKRQTLEKLQITREEVIQQLWYMVTRTSDDFVDEEGKLRELHDLSERAKACVDGIEQEVTTYTTDDGETRETVKTKLKLTGKLGAIDLAMKHKGLFEPEKKETTVKLDWNKLYERPTGPDEIDRKLIEAEGTVIEDGM